MDLSGLCQKPTTSISNCAAYAYDYNKKLVFCETCEKDYYPSAGGTLCKTGIGCNPSSSECLSCAQ